MDSVENAHESRGEEPTNELYFARSNSNSSSSATAIRALVFWVGGSVYAVMCMPAVTQRGFPPIDPIWMVIPYVLWLPAVLATAIFDHRLLRRRTDLAIYCLLTAMVDSATLVTMVPKHFNPLEVLVATCFFFGPIHLLIGFVLSGVVELIKRLPPYCWPQMPKSVARVAQWTMVAIIIAASVALPFEIRKIAIAAAQNSGRARAEEDWNVGKAELYVEGNEFYFSDEVVVRHDYDPATGIKCQLHRPFIRSSFAYQERVEELIAERGIPPWSMKPYLVPEKILVALLDAKNVSGIKGLPHQVNDQIFIDVREEPTGTQALMIWGRERYPRSTGKFADATYVFRRDESPNVVFIRNGHRWIGVFHENGTFLSSASRH